MEEKSTVAHIYYTKKVYSKGFKIGNYNPGNTQDDCKGKCQWESMGVKGWHRCAKCRTEEQINAR